MSIPTSRLMLRPVQLRLVQEIALHGQLQLAAEAVGMTQPAASRTLAEIERLFGAPLFVRQPKGMIPTEIGLSVLRRAQVILRELRNMATDVEALRSGYAGSVSVGAVTGPAVSDLIPAIREVKETAPDADITVDVMPSRDLLPRLMSGEMDFVLARILPDYDSGDFDIIPMRDERVLFIVRNAHPLARAPSVTLTELSDSEWILQQRGAPIREATVMAFARFGLPEPRNVVNSPSMLLSIAYLAQTDAVAPVSEEVASLLIAPPVSGGFTILNMPHEIRVSPYYLLSRKRHPLNPLALRLRERLILRSQQAAQGLLS
ncbi:LysR family transcriptional regulator [Halodurantibacterium flavum]|uniref:LysR family transcriptional regulator n=1 Tax=Halodurantibacterium flavum TaxID=1382802 RepID=A0ABW4S7V6_9RHOB